MTRINNFARLTVAVLLVTAFALPGFAQARGSANFTRFVALGDSYGAGYEAGSLNQRHQLYGWPTIIARQVGLTICPVTAVATDNCFAVPFITDPGLPGAELTFNGAGLVLPPGSGSPVMFGFGRAFNNLSVPGYTVGAALGLTGAEANSGLGQVILRGRGTEVAQALSLNPTFIAIWLGGNDFLGPVRGGDPTGLTSLATFTAQYNALLDALTAGAPNAGMVVGTLPTNFLSAPRRVCRQSCSTRTFSRSSSAAIRFLCFIFQKDRPPQRPFPPGASSCSALCRNISRAMAFRRL